MEKTRRGYTLQTVGERSGYFISIQRGNRVLVYDSHLATALIICSSISRPSFLRNKSSCG